MIFKYAILYIWPTDGKIYYTWLHIMSPVDINLWKSVNV